MTITPLDLAETFAVLKPDLGVDSVAVTSTVYQELDARYSGFGGHVLVACYEFGDNWPTWEKHPAGDEIVVLVSGRATMVLRTASGDTVIELEDSGSHVVIPRNTWHTARVTVPTRMLFITPGAGTENSEDPGDAA